MVSGQSFLKNDEHFVFIIESANDTYDSDKHEFSRLYKGGTETFSIKLSNDEINLIYLELVNADFLNLPSTYEAKGPLKTIVVPSFEYKFESTFKN